MTNVANLENCKRLYELSDWDDTSHWHDMRIWVVSDHVGGYGRYPAYDAGYLLRKLPETLFTGKKNVCDLTVAKTPSCYIADYKYRLPFGKGDWLHSYEKAKMTEADTPEDALCLLAIELFEKGILKKEIKE